MTDYTDLEVKLKPKHVTPLLKKNLRLKLRKYFASFIEIIFPVIFILLFVWAKSLMNDDVEIPSGWSSSEPNESIPKEDRLEFGTSFNFFMKEGKSIDGLDGKLPKYHFTESTLQGVLLNMGFRSINNVDVDGLSENDKNECFSKVAFQGYTNLNKKSPFAVPEECKGKLSPYKIAIAPDTTYTRSYFFEFMKVLYPRISITSDFQIPSFEDSVKFFNTNDDLEEYVKGSNYGKDIDNPRIYAGIVFSQFPTEDNQIGKSYSSIEFNLRFNSSTGDNFDICPTKGDGYEPTLKAILTTCVEKYSVIGFSTLQTNINRFLNCLPQYPISPDNLCQQSKAVGNISDYDDMYFQQVENDFLLQSVISEMNKESGTQINVSSISSDAREKLLIPLRYAPQPFLGDYSSTFPIQGYTSKGFFNFTKYVFALAIVLSYLYPVSKMLSSFIYEKEVKMRELLKIMGVKERYIILSWYITYGIQFFIVAVIQTIFSGSGLFSNSSWVLLFLFFYLFSCSLIAYCYMVSTLFSKSKTGSFSGMVVLFMMYFMTYSYKETSPYLTKLISSLLSPVSLSLGVNILLDLESTNTGLTFSNLFSNYYNFNFFTCILMFVVDFMIYSLLGAYFEQVIPKEYGVVKKWYFPFKTLFCCGKKSIDTNQIQYSPVEPDSDTIEKLGMEYRNQIETGDCLYIQNLTKEFKNGSSTRKAVDSLTFPLFSGEITCLLGHNGAGKSTTINMLTGMLSASSGTAFFKGLNIRDNLDAIRQSLGMCPQHDVLYPDLTVEEHLQLFTKIKGYSSKDAKEMINQFIKEIGLTEKRKVRSKALSGGMKRKLSIAIAFTGNSKIVYLDEPTSGMDPYSRRSTWEVIENNREGRVIVLTTHFMDEADLLGDRIAIMSKGELKCYGSSFFLKKRYGHGYTLTMVKKDNFVNDQAADTKITSFIQSELHGSNILSNVGTEISFQLASENVDLFSTAFKKLEENIKKNDFPIRSYGISVTTMEEVFLNVANEHGLKESNEENSKYMSKPENSREDGAYHLVEEGTNKLNEKISTSFLSHFTAFLKKRWWNGKRDKRALIFSALLPILLFLLGLALIKSFSWSDDDPSKLVEPAPNSIYEGENRLLPYYCASLDGDTEAQGECELAFKNFIPSYNMEAVNLKNEIENDFYLPNPTVFNVTYDDSSFNRSGYFGDSGYDLRFGEMCLKNANKGRQYGGIWSIFSPSKQIYSFNTMVNSSSLHGSSIYKNIFHNGLYKYFSTDFGSSKDVSIKVNNHPLPITQQSGAITDSMLSLISVMFMIIAYSFYPGSVIPFIVKEKSSNQNSKHLQVLSGGSISAFWIANFVWDFANYLFLAICSVILIRLYGVTGFIDTDCDTCLKYKFPATCIIILLTGLSIIPMTYLLSYRFKNPSNCQSSTVMINFMSGIMLIILSFTLDGSDSTKDINKVLKYIWRISPMYNFGNGLLNISDGDRDGANAGIGEPRKSAFLWDIAGAEMIYLAIQFVVFSLLVLYLDSSLFKQLSIALNRKKSDQKNMSSLKTELEGEDDDVVNERERIQSQGKHIDNEVLLLQGVRKVYGSGKSKKIAVKDLSFGLPSGQCFGFLGINGAGKTTTLKMLTGDINPTSGEIEIAGYNYNSDQSNIRKVIGYCPQFDGLIDKMTVFEHLDFFSKLKGLKYRDLWIDKILNQLNLTQFRDVLTMNLSGGNKRKVSVGIALLGAPPVLFLDEPSTGMDPATRRYMWEVLADVCQNDKSTIVLTTHSMEECEALCNRVGIMVGGRLRCLGSIQHLKQKYGKGYMSEMKIMVPSLEQQLNFIQSSYSQFSNISSKEFETRTVDINEIKLILKDDTNKVQILSDPETNHVSAWMLAKRLHEENNIPLQHLIEWYLSEIAFEGLKNYLTDNFVNVEVIERHNLTCRFQIETQSGMGLSYVFKTLEEAKVHTSVVEYNVSQTTLEQIFNSFASQQDEETGTARGME